MEPKFQSSFIPKSPIGSSGATLPTQGRRSERNLFGFVSTAVFSLSVILAMAVFGYSYYLKYAIARMTTELESGRAELQPEKVNELIRLNDRINSTQDLIGTHLLLSPLFKFLEASTIKNVRFTSFSYEMNQSGLRLSMRGEARSYSALALQADLFSKSGLLENVAFSDLVLDEKGNVIFSFQASVDPGLLSYQRSLSGTTVPVVAPAATVVATTTDSTGSRQAATSTPRAATTSPQTAQ